MKRILVLVTISFFLCSTASAFQGGGGESPKKASTKKKAATKKETSGVTSNNTTPPMPPASSVPKRTPAPATVKEQGEGERQYDAIRNAGIAERTRVEQGLRENGRMGLLGSRLQKTGADLVRCMSQVPRTCLGNCCLKAYVVNYCRITSCG